MANDVNDKDDTGKNFEDRIAHLEKRIAELEKKSSDGPDVASNKGPGTISVSGGNQGDIRIDGIVESVVGQFIPGLGGIIKALDQSSPEFRQRIADTDAEIKHRIDVGWSSKPAVDYHISTRPMRHGPMNKNTAPRTQSIRMPDVGSGPIREPIVDVLEAKDGITVIAELPGISEEDLSVNLSENIVEIKAGQFSKKVSLPRSAGSILEKTYRNGILQLKLN
jgi:HSP20 family molecular chaperone IbpA